MYYNKWQYFGQSENMWDFCHILVETMRLVVNTEKEKTMSELMTQLLERLAEMFPKQNYQSRLEQYIASRRPTSAAEIEMLERQYYRLQTRGVV
jgi:hypothetical protein